VEHVKEFIHNPKSLIEFITDQGDVAQDIRVNSILYCGLLWFAYLLLYLLLYAFHISLRK